MFFFFVSTILSDFKYVMNRTVFSVIPDCVTNLTLILDAYLEDIQEPVFISLMSFNLSIQRHH